MLRRDLLRPSVNLPFEILAKSAKTHSKAACRCSEEEEGNCSMPQLDIVKEPFVDAVQVPLYKSICCMQIKI